MEAQEKEEKDAEILVRVLASLFRHFQSGGMEGEGFHTRVRGTMTALWYGKTLFNQLKTTPTPNKNGSYGIKGGVRMPYFWAPHAVFSVEIP